MKLLLLPLCFIMIPHSIAQTSDSLYRQACGAVEATVAPQPQQVQNATSPGPEKALVFLIQRDDNFGLSTRAGLDGSWVSTIRRDAYLPLIVSAGEHHLCVATQNLKKREAELVYLQAEPGKTYYFVVEGRYTFPGPTQRPHIAMSLKQVDRDEALYLIASDAEAAAKKTP